ncbi:MAG: ABC transporter ATP-binding protein [Thermoleophilia bacterium]|nr:ABC transporter ATP-binding protein [Thermoleophilia bacterium]
MPDPRAGTDSASGQAASVTPPLLEAEAVQVTIGKTDILKRADLCLESGELVAVVGPNGAGKSTFARAFCGLQKATGGSIRWSGEDISAIRGRRLARLRAFVPQRAQVPNGVTVSDAVAIGRSAHLKPLQSFSAVDREAIASATSRARLEGMEDRQLNTLSGGELQRVQIAVGLAQGAPVLVADEPTAQLDLGATAAVSELLRELVHDGYGIVLIVHDLALAAAVADRVVVMSDGATIATGPPVEVLSKELIGEVWNVEAELISHEGRSGLHVEWLGRV